MKQMSRVKRGAILTLFLPQKKIKPEICPDFLQTHFKRKTNYVETIYMFMVDTLNGAVTLNNQFYETL